MPPSDTTQAFQQMTRDGPWLLLTVDVSPAQAAMSGRWLASGDYVAVEP